MHAATLWGLAPRLMILPVSELNAETVAKIDGCEETDVAVTLPRSRRSSIIVDEHTAGILRSFEKPCTLVDAVLLYSLPRGIEPEELLRRSIPGIENCVRKGFLLDSEKETKTDASKSNLRPGDQVEDFRVLRQVHFLDDVEIHLVRLEKGDGARFAALKLERKSGLGSWRREADILRDLDGEHAPRLLREGRIDGRRYLLIEWIQGVEAPRAFDEWRRRPSGRQRLLGLAIDVARAYASLHGRGVLHGDVHPRNLLVEAGGEIRLIDFGIGVRVGEKGSRKNRAGVPFFFEPEHAQAILEKRGGVAPSEKGEQYAVGALLHSLLTGDLTHDFSLERSRLMEQLAHQPQRSFAEQGLEPWPEIEEVLSKALAKRPEDRFSSCTELAEALEGALGAELSVGRASVRVDWKKKCVNEVLAAAAPDGDWAREAWKGPTASVKLGAAGVACGLLNIAEQRSDPSILGLADWWYCKALELSESESGFVDPEAGLTRQLVGFSTPLHSISGVHAVGARLGRARGDMMLYLDGVGAFIENSSLEARGLDLTLGKSATVLQVALLLEGAVADEDLLEPLVALGRSEVSEIWQELVGWPRISTDAQLGLAHGWAGFLYAALQWSRVTGEPLPAELSTRLEELAGTAEPHGRGLAWRWLGTDQGYMPGWCNGSAGFVFLWTLAWRMLGEERYLRMARGAAWHVWEQQGRVANLCCGLVGQAYALLNLYRHSGERIWLARAEDLASLVADASRGKGKNASHSLYKGDMAIAALAADLETPELAAMPFFEGGDWDGSISAAKQRLESGLAA